MTSTAVTPAKSDVIRTTGNPFVDTGLAAIAARREVRSRRFQRNRVRLARSGDADDQWGLDLFMEDRGDDVTAIKEAADQIGGDLTLERGVLVSAPIRRLWCVHGSTPRGVLVLRTVGAQPMPVDP